MGNFREKAIFVWNDTVIGSPERITELLTAAGFQGAHLHSSTLSGWPKVSRVNLAKALKAAGISVYASIAIYGYDPAGDGARAASLVNEYGLDGCVLDVEAGLYEDARDAPARVRTMLNAYKSATDQPVAFCWWMFYRNWVPPYNGYHLADVLRAAMETADVGMPMAYWNWGDDPASAVRYLNESWKQWRELTDKPIVMAGRAFLGDGGTAKPEAVLAYDARARQLGAVGMTWWSMEHALNESAVPGVWAALAQTPKFGSTTPGGNNMWEHNALIAAFEPIGSNPPAATIDFAALKAAGIHATLLQAGTSSDKLNYDDPSAGYMDDPNYVARFRAATAAGLRTLIGYDFNAALDSVNSYNGSVTLRHLNWLTSGTRKPPVGGALVLNCERNTWWESIKQKTCNANMYGQDLSNVAGQLWNLHHLVPAIRTGKWFLDKRDEGGTNYGSQIAWLDGHNKPPDENMPLFMARWKKTKAQVAGDFHALIADVQDPDGAPAFALDGKTPVDEQAYYLYFGNYTKWRGWEIATVYHPAVKDANGAPALFRLILWRGTPEEFDAFFNFPAQAPADNQPPSVPANLQAVGGTNSVSLSWSPSTDNVGVKVYRVWRNGLRIVEITQTQYVDENMGAGVYRYQVDACDAAGNASEKTPEVSATVTGSQPDTQPPSVPAGLAMQMEGAVPVLSWQPATDNVGVVGYRIFRDGTQVGLSTGTAFHDSILPPGTYQYQVSAYDQAGNVSALSAALSVTISGDGPSDPEIKALLQRIEAQQAQLASLVQALTNAHQVTAGKVAEIRSKFS